MKECYVECPWACITSQGFGCAIAFNAIRGESSAGVNLEVLPDYLMPQEEVEEEDEVSEL